MDSILQTLVGSGPLGLVVALLILFIRQLANRLDKAQNDLVAEKEARVADAKGYTAMALDLQGKLLAAVDKLAEVSRNRGPA